MGLKQLPPVIVTHIVSRFLGREGFVGQLPHLTANEVDGGPQSTDPLVSGLGLSCRPHLSPHVWPGRPLWPVRTLHSTGEGHQLQARQLSASPASLALSPGDCCGAQEAPSTYRLPRSITLQLGSRPRGEGSGSWSLVPVRPVACPAWAPGHQGQVALGCLMGVLEPRDLVSLQPFPSSGQELCWGAEKAEAARPPCWSSQRMWNVQTGPSPSAPALPLHAGSLRLPLLSPCPQDEANTHHGQLLVLQPGHGGALREPQLLGLPAL